MTGHWDEQAACRDVVDDTVFFPEQRLNMDPRRWDLARLYCQSCPVQTPCLEEALAVEGDVAGGQRYGMRGGMTPDERAAFARRRDGAA